MNECTSFVLETDSEGKITCWRWNMGSCSPDGEAGWTSHTKVTERYHDDADLFGVTYDTSTGDTTINPINAQIFDTL